MGGCLASGSVIDSDGGQLWQDRMIRWDQPKNVMLLRNGEFIQSAHDDVEDTKGDNGIGQLQITSLRLLWISKINPKLNISIGLGNVAYIHFNMVDSSNFQRVRAPNLMTQYNNTRFEFTFAVDSGDSMKLFHDLEAVIRRYRATRTYRDLILRDEALLIDSDLSILPHEELKDRIDGCENLTTDEAFPGVLFVTNLRVVWYTRTSPNINVSVPYVQTKSLGTRLSRFGNALVIETSPLSGGYILGFKFSDTMKLSRVGDLIMKLFHESRRAPYFGPYDVSVQIVDDRLVIVPPAQTQQDESSPNVASISVVPCSQPLPANLTQPTISHSQIDIAQDITSVASEGPIGINGSSIAGGGGAVGVTSSVMISGAGTGGLSLPDGAVNIRRENNNSNHGRGTSAAPPVSREPVTLDLTKRNDKEHVTNQNGVFDSGLVSPQSRKYRAPKCVICMAKPDECAFDPCGHVCACMDCAVQLDDCPICRRTILKVLRVFLTS